MRIAIDPMSITPTTEATELIATRRSARGTFDGTPIDHAELREIVSCGLAAPSSKNARPWRFHVVTDRRLLGSIADAAVGAPDIDGYVPTDAATGRLQPWGSSVVESAALLRSAPAAIFIENSGVFSSGRPALIAASREVLEAALIGYTFEAIGIGTAIENILLAAHALGVHGTFMGDLLIVEEIIATSIGVQSDLVGVIVLGRGDLSVPAPLPLELPDEYDLVTWHS